MIRKLSLAVAVAGLLAACGGEKKPEAAPAKAADGAPAAAAPAAGQTTLTVATVNNGDMVVMQELSKNLKRPIQTSN